MAELALGQHCGVADCRQLDFLPFVCDGCSGVFCLQHRSRDAHGCSEVNIRNNSVKPDQHRSYPCSYKDCNEKELLPVLCPYCEKHFCLRHRHQSDHECEKLDTPKPRMAATQQLVKHIIDSKKNEEAKSKKHKGAKNSETAAKVALMKLKMHACGDKSLPQKLRLCHTASGEALPFEHTLERWLSDKDYPLYNGGNIILEYLGNDVLFIEDTESYFS
ncbi:AN1-type zinc finger protein 1 isoform X2 [Calonectris borealis]|uniref:AN1-type zinc finger protein 1 isoform X2 n=1 Tax=Calonectris borealis TaxID=1323832 RepID=UPI003F4BB6B3